MYNFGIFGDSGAYVPYGTLNLTASSPPQSFTEPLTMAEVKDYLRLPQQRSPVDPDEDNTLSALISAAREQAEICQGRDLVRKQWDLNFDYWPTWTAIELRPDLASVDLVQYTDSDNIVTPLVENTDYIVDTAKQPGIIQPAYNTSWPSFTGRPSSAILIRFTSGKDATSIYWSDAGVRVKVGMRLLIAGWFNRRLPFSAQIMEDPMLDVLLGYGRLERVK